MLKDAKDVSEKAKKRAAQFVKSGSPICSQTNKRCDGCFGSAFEQDDAQNPDFYAWNEFCAYQK